MTMVVVGGHDRMQKQYDQICKAHGYRPKIFTQMPAQFDKKIGNADGIILFTNTVSHKMTRIAVKEAKRKDIPLVRNHSSSLNALEHAIELFHQS